ncbi:MAG: hypothetical protein Q4G49_07610 [Paracoccus sp. (in: a-proteobacteria)]|nr:hypothetical protein [Paracoccus sp. (in: a-proteobacteria)]
MATPARSAEIIPFAAVRHAGDCTAASLALASAARQSAAAGTVGLSAMQEVMADLFTARAGEVRRDLFRGKSSDPVNRQPA